MDTNQVYFSPEITVFELVQGASVCTGSPLDTAGDKMTEGDYIYEY